MNLDELRRSFATNPDDENLRAQLIIALRRSGHDNEARRYIKDRFDCPISWDQLTQRSRSREANKYCQECKKDVYFVSTVEELGQRAAKNECVVGPKRVVDQYCDELAKMSLPLSNTNKELPHCMNSVAGKTATREDLKHFPKPVALAESFYSLVPMTLQTDDESNPKTLILVTNRPLSDDTIQRFINSTGVETCEVHFASNDLIYKLDRERLEIFPYDESNFAVALGAYPSPPPLKIFQWIRRKITGED